MNVLIDSSLFTLGIPERTGHGRIWTNLFQRIPDDMELFCNSRLRNLPPAMRKPLRGSPIPTIRPYRIGTRISDWASRVIAARYPVNLLAPSLYVPQAETLKLARRIPLVVLLDDLTPEMVPGTMPAWLKPKRAALEASSLIVSISESTKALAMDYYGLPAERFRVAPLASDIVRPEPSDSARIHDRPYFLVVGNRQGYKNFALTLRAFAMIADRCRDLDLLLAGPPITDFEEKAMVDLAIRSRVHHAGRVDDTLLAKLYAQSVAFVYPSLSEGFGIPPLEAMICGTVPIVSNCSSMPEVVGDAGLLIDPKNADSLAEAMESIVSKPDLRRGLVAKGTTRSEIFSWSRTTDLIFAAWREAAGR